MERTSRWLIVSIIIAGIGIIFFAGKLGYDYGLKQARKAGAAVFSEASSEMVSSETSSENMSEGLADENSQTSDYTEDPYRKIKKRIGCTTLVEGNVLEMGGFELELLDVEYTQEHGDWIGSEGLVELFIQQADENMNILSDEQYIVLHMRATAKEEKTYNYEAGVNRLPVQNFRVFFCDMEQESVAGYEVFGAGGDVYENKDAANMFVLDLDYEETKEFTVVFVDTDSVLRTNEELYMIFTPNISGGGIVSGSEADVWKGLIQHVEN